MWRGLIVERIFFRTVDCCLIWMLTANIDSVILDKKAFSPVAAHTDGWTACFDFPLWHLFFVGVGASYWPRIHLSWIRLLNIISHILQILISHLSAFSLGMVSILCPRWWPYPLAPSSSMGGPPWRIKDSLRTECFSDPPPPPHAFIMEAWCIIYVVELVKVVPILLMVLMSVMPLYCVFNA